MSAPLIGMPFASFVVLLIVSGIAGAIVHWGFRYRLFNGVDGCLGQWMLAWVGAWLGPAVLVRLSSISLTQGLPNSLQTDDSYG
jgi:uncharacterized membrane protein YeaQ/YmgE (transglycosylase-associated protein family)